MQLPNTTGDELGILRTKIQNNDGIVGGQHNKEMLAVRARASIIRERPHSTSAW